MYRRLTNMKNKVLDLKNYTMIYSDEESGNQWEVEIFDCYKTPYDAGVTLLVSDNIEIHISGRDLLGTFENIKKEMAEQYANAIDNLEYKNV